MKHCTSPARSMAIWSLAAICAAIVLQPVVGMTLAPPNQGSANDVVLGLMNGTVLPWIKSESDAAQTALNNSIDAFGLCLSGRAQRRADLESAVNASKSAHEQCRSNQSALYVPWKTCNDLLVILGGVKNSSCANLVTVTGQPAVEADECHTNGHQSYINWLRDQSTRFQTKATTWHSANSSCANATEAYTSKESECEPHRTAVDAEKSNCDDAQKSYETGFCSLGTEIEALCDPTCYTAASRAYNDSIQGIQSGERSRKVTWRVVKRIMCLMSVLGDSGGSEADIEACKNATYSTDLLNLVYLAVPARTPCAEVSLPCSTPFLDAYDPMPIHTQAAACTQCPTVPPPPVWVTLFETGSFGDYLPNKEAFNAHFRSGSSGLLRRECSGSRSQLGCSISHKDIYIKVFSPETWDAYEELLVTWTANRHHELFELYSTLDDAQQGAQPWQSCNGNDSGVGFPRDCGPSEKAEYQWNSLLSNLRRRINIRFSVLGR